MKKVRKHFVFSGKVQGVGFRYRAAYAAKGIGLTGWVKNNLDGSVEMEVQGTIDQINKMLILLNQGNYIIINNIEEKEITLDEKEKKFHIR